MQFPGFFEDVKKIIFHDPLAEFLGAAAGGLMEYGYPDAVRLAGHSCPTVAGAYLMTWKALNNLYEGENPERGAIRVEFRDDVANGVTGVMANVVGLLTGAAQAGGFKGIGGRFDRRNLLSFNRAAVSGEIRFTRLDTGAGVDAAYRPELVPPAPAMRDLMQKSMAGVATIDEREEFGRLWQDRVKRILIDQFDNPELVVLSKPKD
jgi:hypothetical protein